MSYHVLCPKGPDDEVFGPFVSSVQALAAVKAAHFMGGSHGRRDLCTRGVGVQGHLLLEGEAQLAEWVERRKALPPGLRG